MNSVNASASLPVPAERRRTRLVHVGPVAVGGGAPISVQTMTKTDTRDVAATVAQIRDVAAAGCDIVRLAVVDSAAARALGEIRREAPIPLIADVHFDHRLAIASVEAGADGLRINPGNIGDAAKVREVVVAARERRVPIRIGVNSGSLEKDLEERHGAGSVAALVESAMRHVRLIEGLGHPGIKISVKASDVARTVQAYRALSARTDYPLHLGVTEAGTFIGGTVRSSVAMGILLAEGIGDTLRVSLTDTPLREVRVGQELLRSLGLRDPGASVISCPTCGRIQVDVVSLTERLERALDARYREGHRGPKPRVAVMGCMVNGPGEARHADIALAGGKGCFALYVQGRRLKTVAEDKAVETLLEAVAAWPPSQGAAPR